MPSSRKSRAPFAGQRVKPKMLLALTLASFIPLLVLMYVLQSHIIPLLDPSSHRLLIASLQGLLVFTALLMVTGSYLIWDVATAVTRSAEIMASTQQIGELEERGDEIGTVMASFSRMLTTIEQQAAEINSFAERLESAYRELEGTNARLKDLSFKDDITGLYNRRFFSIRLEEEISRYRRFTHPVSVVLLDLDGFKQINDEFGHAAGDETLREIAQLLLKHSRGINVIARYGGDEFAILLVETTKSGARLYADRIRQVLSAFPFGHRQRITASFGLASLPEDVGAASPEELIRAADAALYAAKRAGKNTVAAYEPTGVEIKTD